MLLAKSLDFKFETEKVPVIDIMWYRRACKNFLHKSIRFAKINLDLNVKKNLKQQRKKKERYLMNETLA